MGLAEKRGVEEFKKTSFPDWEKKITEAGGFKVEMDIQWDKLAAEGYASSYGEFFSKVYFEPLMMSFKSIAQDDMGRDALKGALKKVVITNTSNHSSGRNFTFEGGVLTLDHASSVNVDDVKERTQYITKLLEAGL